MLYLINKKEKEKKNSPSSEWLGWLLLFFFPIFVVEWFNLNLKKDIK